MFDRTIGSDPRPAAPQSRASYRMRDGHRREYAASRDRGSISFRERCRGALADIGIYGAVSVPRPRRGSLRRPSLHHAAGRQRLERARSRYHDAHGTQGSGRSRSMTLHAQGSGQGPDLDRTAHQIRRSPPPTRPARARHGHLPGLRPRTPTLARAGRRHTACTARRRAQERRVTHRSESARARDGRRAADAERHRAARELELPIDEQGRVLYPDAQIEYTDSEGRSGRVNMSRSHRGTTARWIRPGQGRGRVPAARKRAGRSAGA